MCASRGYLGVDLAWNVNGRTGLAVVDEAGRLVASSSVSTDDEIDDWVSTCGLSVAVAAIDAPLVVENETGMRPCEVQIGRAFGRYDASCHASNRSKKYMAPPRGGLLVQRHGWSLDTRQQNSVLEAAAIEVYPHAAMVGLFGLDRILKYKKGALSARREAFLLLFRHMESIEVLALPGHERWSQLRSAVGNDVARQTDLNRAEDEVDAILCAHLAWLWKTQPDALVVYGDATDGFIVAPPAPTHATSGRPAIKEPPLDRPVVAFWVDGRPATFATAHEQEWKRRVTIAGVGAMADRSVPDARFSVELEFVLPQTTHGGERWDLDNLIKPTIDALGAVVGRRQWQGPDQVDDERVDRIIASKRRAVGGEGPGAMVRVSVAR